ncbi:MAG: 1-phosphofructokinase family hexose kinase [Deltaproteobacteria bacterium]|jgi:1-phosphofructokinase|nr:1-phosphofructokinase family hexose kinase [Deltaproteobacteria bacterium]
MIYTVSLNPTLHYIAQVKNFGLGKINYSSFETFILGSKGIHVSTMLNYLGHPSVAWGFLAGPTGEIIAAGLQKEQSFETDFIFLKQGFTRLKVTIHSTHETELIGRGPIVTEDDLELLLKKTDILVPGDCLVLAGDVPFGVNPNIYGRFIEKVKDREVLTVVFASGELLKEALPHRPFLIKINQAELTSFFGEKPKDFLQMLKFGTRLHHNGPHNILLSLGASGALLFASNGKTLRIPGIKGQERNIEGPGESMVAGFLAGYLDTSNFIEALKVGAAAGTATAFSTTLANRDTVIETLKLIPNPELLD